MKRLAGKTAIVTGASKGIGAGIARELARQGARVVVNSASDRSGADKVVAAIEAEGGQAIAVQASVAIAADVKRLFAETSRAYGEPDILVNNAAVYSATKGALDALTRVLAAELGSRGIRVNTLVPGGTHTEGIISAGFIGSTLETDMIERTPLGRLGQPQDIAKVAALAIQRAFSSVPLSNRA